jgi:hypothetical protein
MFGLMDRNSGYLFSSRHLSDILDARRHAVQAEIENLDANRLLNTSPTDLAEYLVGKFRLEPVKLVKEQWSADEHETQYDARRDPDRWVRDQNRPLMIPAQQIDVEVPFEGEGDLLFARPNTYNSAPPRATIRRQSLLISHVLPHDSSHDIKQEITRTLADIEEYLSWQRAEIDGFNSSLPATASNAIAARRNRLLANQGRVASLGIPLKVRADAPKTYTAPEVRVKVAPKLPPTTTAPYVQEPALDQAHYEHVLAVLQNMIHVIERSPSAFARMGEEDLRQHFLVQ